LSATAELLVEISCGKTDTQTNSRENHTSATVVGVGKDVNVLYVQKKNDKRNSDNDSDGDNEFTVN